MSNQAEPIVGQEAICSMCDQPIVYVGPYWDHPGEIKPRHPALPKIDEEQPRPMDIEPHMAIRSVMFDLMARKAGWKGKPDPNGVVVHMEMLIAALERALKDLRHYNNLKKALSILKDV